MSESRSQVGAGNDEDVFVARASVGTYRDTLRQVELAREQAIRALEILLGRYPAGVAMTTPLPPLPPAVPAGLPSELLERRPDVIATPHVGGLTPEAIAHQALETVRQTAEILQGRAPVGAANPEHARRLARLG